VERLVSGGKLFSRSEGAPRNSGRVFNAGDFSAHWFQTFHVWLPSQCAFGARCGILEQGLRNLAHAPSRPIYLTIKIFASTCLLHATRMIYPERRNRINGQAHANWSLFFAGRCYNNFHIESENLRAGHCGARVIEPRFHQHES
jgi:hypothetical protein